MKKRTLQQVEDAWQSGKISDETALKEFGRFVNVKQPSSNAIRLWNQASTAVRRKQKRRAPHKGFQMDRNRSRYQNRRQNG